MYIFCNILQGPVTTFAAQSDSATPADDGESKQKKMKLSLSEKASTSADQKPTFIEGMCKIQRGQLQMDRNQIIGSGSYGHVIRGTFQTTPVAVKEVYFECKNKNFIPPSIDNEIQSSAFVRHRSIVSFIGFTYDIRPQLKSLLLVYELIDGYNLAEIVYDDDLIKSMNFTEPKRYDVLYQISQALVYLHTRDPKIIHGDIKPSNMILSKQGTAKLCDLGLSKIKKNKSVSVRTTVVACGTPIYMSPEQLLKTKSSSTKSDMYSFGVSVYEILFADHIWGVGDSDDFRQLDLGSWKKKVEVEKIPQKVHTKMNHCLYTMILNCVQFEHDKRPDAMAVVTELEKLCNRR